MSGHDDKAMITVQEEKILASHFIEKYLEYKKRTKILIPFVW